jgi:hypothetical protein
VGAIACGVLALLIGPLAAFEARWRGLKDGMTETQVRQALGPPSWVGTSGTIGAGNQKVIRWDYSRSFLGRPVHYCVDFDYVGVKGAPVVFRTDRW